MSSADIFCHICYRNLEKQDRFIIYTDADLQAVWAYTLSCKKEHIALHVLEENNSPIYYEFELIKNKIKYFLIGNHKKYDETVNNFTYLYQEIATKHKFKYSNITNATIDYRIISQVPQFLPINLIQSLPSQIERLVDRMLIFNTFS